MSRLPGLSRSTLFAALILLVAAPAFAGEHQMSYADALAAAKERDTVVVIDFFTDWCTYCKQFDAALANGESGIATALDAVVFTSIDAEKGEGVELARKYGVSGFPTYTVVNAKGELIESWSGFGGADHFLGAFETAMSDPLTFDEKKARYAAGPTVEQAQNLSRIAATSSSYAEAMDYIHQAEKMEPELDMSGQLLDAAYGRSRRDDTYSKDDFIALARERVLEGDADAETTLMTTYYVANATRDEEDHATVKPFLLESRKAMASGADLPAGLVAEIELKALILVDADMDAAVEQKRSMMPEGWMDNADRLNEFAWWCFENDVNLEEAQALALKGVELAEPGAERATILDTAAEICVVLGNCNQAIELIQVAMNEDAGNEYYAEQLARFQKIQAEQEG